MKLVSKIPAGQSGEWRVEKYEVSEMGSKLDFLRSMLHASKRYVPPGKYTRLKCDGRGIIMSDTPDELRDFSHFVHKAHGTVLINGLGLGCLAQALLEKPEVTEVTVIEISQDVINLVAPHLADPRLTVIHADAYVWGPPKGKRWDCVWHDIWDNICTDNLELMARLHRKYARRAEFQASWQHDFLKHRKRQEQRMGW
jgi:hypothetical protein